MPAPAPTAPRIGQDQQQPESPRLSMDENPRCGVCPHPVGDHDAIALRFCRATENAATARGCVCGPA